MTTLMTPKTRTRPAPERTHTHGATHAISYAMSECALGELLVARSVNGVCAILIGSDRDQLNTDLAAIFPNTNLIPNDAFVHNDLAKVIGFMDNPAAGLHLPLDMRGTLFQRRVWEKLRAIPVGRTVTYTDVAYWVGPLTWPLAVADACASNPIALAVPCHRVVRSNGDLGGYRWGVERKREMIRREAISSVVEMRTTLTMSASL